MLKARFTGIDRGARSFAAMARGVRPALLEPMRGLMALARAIAAADTPVRTGRTQDSVSRADIQARLTSDGVEGSLGRIWFVVNFLEAGASIGGTTISPRNASVLRFFVNGVPVFARSADLAGRSIPARPVLRPAVESVIPKARPRFIRALQQLADTSFNVTTG